MALRLFMPLQHPCDSVADFPVAYGMHGASDDPTWPHVTAADASPAAISTTTNAARARKAVALLLAAIDDLTRSISLRC
jgi:hypothetical protein